MANVPLNAVAISSLIPNRTFKPKAAPATFPMLKAKPPSPIMNAMISPRPGKILFAISCPLKPVTPITLQMVSWVILSSTMTQRII